MLELLSGGMAFNKRVHVMRSIKLKPGEESREVEKWYVIPNVSHASM